MEPALTVEGKKFEIYGLYYRANKLHSVTAFDENGTMVEFHDISENVQYYHVKPVQIDFEKCLYWVGRYDDVFDSLESLIESQQKETQDLATQIADIDTPYPDYELIKKRNDLKQRTFGLMDAQDIVSEFMTEDVDLSGGEEIDGDVRASYSPVAQRGRA